MDLAANLHLRPSFLTGSSLPRSPLLRTLLTPKSTTTTITASSPLSHKSPSPIITHKTTLTTPSATALDTSTAVLSVDDIESLFSSNTQLDSSSPKRGKKSSNSSGGASAISSGIKLENIRKGYKGVTVLKDVTWEVKKGEKVGLVGVNGAGKTTQLRIITGQELPDAGNVIKAKPNMKIAFLSQEFQVRLSNTVREEFLSAFKEEMDIKERLERVQKAIEGSVDDLELMGRLLDEFDLLQRRAQAVDLDEVDAKISKLLPELGFTAEDGDRLVASFSGGWQMRMSLGKILLQEPDLLLLDEPTNHLDLDTIEWLLGFF